MGDYKAIMVDKPQQWKHKVAGGNAFEPEQREVRFGAPITFSFYPVFQNP